MELKFEAIKKNKTTTKAAVEQSVSDITQVTEKAGRQWKIATGQRLNKQERKELKNTKDTLNTTTKSQLLSIMS